MRFVKCNNTLNICKSCEYERGNVDEIDVIQIAKPNWLFIGYKSVRKLSEKLENGVRPWTLYNNRIRLGY